MIDREGLEELFSEQPELLMMDEHVNAIVGVAQRFGEAFLVYDRDTIHRNLAAETAADPDAEQDPDEAAEEWITFNIEGAYVGEHTPLLVEEISYDARVWLAQRQWQGERGDPRDPAYWERRGKPDGWPFKEGS